MRKALFSAALATLVLALMAGSALAAGWAITLDTPLSYTFNSGNSNTPAAGRAPSTWNGSSTTQVSGSKVLLITPIHIGFGYEDYSVRNGLTFPAFGGTGTGQVNTNFRIYDVALDLPMRYLNLTFGYGQGTADTDFTVLSGPPGTGTPSPIRNATVTQYFAVVGIPLGERLNIHVGYHWLTVQAKDMVIPGTNPPFDQTLLDGQMVSAGIRLNF